MTSPASHSNRLDHRPARLRLEPAQAILAALLAARDRGVLGHRHQFRVAGECVRGPAPERRDRPAGAWR